MASRLRRWLGDMRAARLWLPVVLGTLLVLPDTAAPGERTKPRPRAVRDSDKPAPKPAPKPDAETPKPAPKPDPKPDAEKPDAERPADPKPKETDDKERPDSTAPAADDKSDEEKKTDEEPERKTDDEARNDGRQRQAQPLVDTPRGVRRSVLRFFRKDRLARIRAATRIRVIDRVRQRNLDSVRRAASGMKE